jgi:hypothetical protein
VISVGTPDDASSSMPRDDGDPGWLSTIKCFKCQKKGYFSRYCPDKKMDENGKVVGLMVGNEDIVGSEDENSYSDFDEFTVHQSQCHVNKNWILLDNCSTTNIICNMKLLTTIQTADTVLKIHCNSRSKVVTQVDTLCNYGTVWYSNDALANILSLTRVKNPFPIKYDQERKPVYHHKTRK